MNPRISPRDLEQLSAYLDGSLPDRASTLLASRLKAEPQLAQALQQLETTRAMLRRAPQRRVPRSFVLNRNMLAAPAKGFFASWNSFNFASALASLLLVITIIGDFSVNGVPAFAIAPAAAEPQAMMLEAPADAASGAMPAEEPFAVEEPMPEMADEARLGEPTMKQSDGLSAFFAQHAGTAESILFLIALISGLIALDKRRKQNS